MVLSTISPNIHSPCLSRHTTNYSYSYIINSDPSTHLQIQFNPLRTGKKEVATSLCIGPWLIKIDGFIHDILFLGLQTLAHFPDMWSVRGLTMEPTV